MQAVDREGVLGLLRKVDPTFSSGADYGFRAQNADGYFVDLFCPDLDPPAARLTRDDIDPIGIAGGDWLAAATKVDEMVIGTDGLPARMVCVEPRVFALHKAWLSKQPDRQNLSRPRDRQQARVAAQIAANYLAMKIDKRFLKRMPAELVETWPV